MTVRESFVEHFGEDAALRVEEAATAHMAEGSGLGMPDPHESDRWGSDAFRYLFLVCVGRDCFTRWREYHRIYVSYEDIREWALKHAGVEDFDGDVPDYLALFAGAYSAWIDWERLGIEPPDGRGTWLKRNHEWAHMTAAEFEVEAAMNTENMRYLNQKARSLFNEHGE